MHLPSKKDLSDLLDKIGHRDTPAVSDALDNFVAAKKAREDFQRHSKKWRQLRRAEKTADRNLRRIRDEERERLVREISGCRDDLLLNGVTPDLVERIRQLFHLDDDA
jgi:hypothetical protein